MTKRYETVLNDILEKISCNVYAEGGMLPTENEMVNYYNVSRITIQKAMNILVSRQIIERTPGKGTFLKSKDVTNILTENKTDFYSIIIPFMQPETMKIVETVQAFMSQKGCYLTVHFTNRDENEESSIIDKIIRDGSKGIIMYPYFTTKNTDNYYKLLHRGFPTVFIDKAVKGLVSNVVMSDNYGGAYDIVDHMIRMGHRKIAFLSYKYSRGSSLYDRFKGYLHCLKDNNIPFDKNIIAFNASDELEIPNKLSSIFEKCSDITAIMCATDDIAINTYKWLYAHDLKIPDDISVCGFDNTIAAQAMTPKLTTVEQNYSEIGLLAAEMLYEINQTNSSTVTKKVFYVPTNLMKRDSVKKI